jgi:hypothetical protein
MASPENTLLFELLNSITNTALLIGDYSFWFRFLNLEEHLKYLLKVVGHLLTKNRHSCNQNA